jgi:hypothetical protein
LIVAGRCRFIGTKADASLVLVVVVGHITDFRLFLVIFIMALAEEIEMKYMYI